MQVPELKNQLGLAINAYDVHGVEELLRVLFREKKSQELNILAFKDYFFKACGLFDGEPHKNESSSASDSTSTSTKNSISIAQAFVREGMSVHETNAFGLAALHHASTPEMVRYLHSVGANLDAQDSGGRTALHWASNLIRECNSVGIIREMAQLGADINVRDKDGQTALHHLIAKATKLKINMKSEGYERKFVESLDALIAAGADVNARDIQGLTPLSMACWAVHNDGIQTPMQIECLLNAGAVFDAHSGQMEAAAVYAVNTQDMSLLHKLFSQGFGPQSFQISKPGILEHACTGSQPLFVAELLGKGWRMDEAAICAIEKKEPQASECANMVRSFMASLAAKRALENMGEDLGGEQKPGRLKLAGRFT